MEGISFIDHGTHKTLKLPKLSDDEKFIIDPIIAPTSGLRIQILDQSEKRGKEKFLLTNSKLYLFLRVFKAISQQYKEMKNGKNLKILIVTDNRPSSMTQRKQ